uniref:BTB domain-containing protein n=1 Tax=Heliothis virescens TaxID=7102 RepID=A0A2A4K9T4_HELVI
MVQSQFSLSWDSYKSSICSGFSALQQNGEFVDMTIAADGHLVKVHQVLVALASPYLKDLITSAPCQHPVIFLNNVTHRTLCLLLEYIYTGEVVVPAECLSSFAETAKSLHIRGLENISTAESLPIKLSGNTSHLDDSDVSRITASPSDKFKQAQINLPTSARKIFIKKDPSMPSIASVASIHSPLNTQAETPQDDHHNYSDLMDDSGPHEDDDDMDYKTDDTKEKEIVQDKKEKPSSSNLQFTVSIRGSLQVILNRYIYNLHSTTSRAGLRRWRCVDYRNNKCTAFLVTKGNVVLNRANLHNHSFHDKKILAKIEKKAVFSAIDEVEGYKELPAEGQGNIMSLEEFGDDVNDKKNDTTVKD